MEITSGRDLEIGKCYRRYMSKPPYAEYGYVKRVSETHIEVLSEQGKRFTTGAGTLYINYLNYTELSEIESLLLF